MRRAWIDLAGAGIQSWIGWNRGAFLGAGWSIDARPNDSRNQQDWQPEMTSIVHGSLQRAMAEQRPRGWRSCIKSRSER